VLDDEVRAVICPDKISTAQWLEVHETAHAVGLRSNNTIMFGHADAPRSWARHLIAVRELQRRTGGFTEFVPLPFVHMEAPMYLKGRARRGPTFGEVLLMHAVGRLALHPWIENVQVSWVKAGPQGVLEALRAGANDLGGTLMNESISRAAGAAWGQELPPERMEALIRAAGRIPRQRTTLYGHPRVEQVVRSFGAAPLAAPRNPHVNEARLARPRRLVRPAAR
jgi:FO synthase